jgi:hypothetical protein
MQQLNLEMKIILFLPFFLQIKSIKIFIFEINKYLKLFNTLQII